GGLPIGGTCVNVGCVPSKILIEMSKEYYYTQYPRYNSLHGKCIDEIGFSEAMMEKNQLVNGLRQSNYVEVLNNLEGVEIITGMAKFISPNEVIVNGKKIRGEKIIIATGSRSRIIPFPGLENINYMTNREILTIDQLPERLIVIGAGPIGLELAQAFFHFGSEVVILEKAEQILPNVDSEIADELRTYLEDEGMKIFTETKIVQIKEENGLKTIKVEIDDRETIITGSHILIAVGVIPNTDKLNVENVGIKLSQQGFIQVNEYLQTNVPHIYAVGDVAGNAFLETVAAKEGYIAASNLLEGTHKTIDYSSVPRAVFTTPQVAMVGMSEDEFMEKFNTCSCRTIEIASVPKAKALKETKGLIKMVIHPDTNVIVGVQMVGPLAADIIHEATLAVKFKLTIDDLIDTIHVFPTFSEGLKRVAQAFRRDINVMSCCID
ncbi:MAG: mercury(II) reductase, partial [Candidatus Heimdallarchaeota archaeon]